MKVCVLASGSKGNSVYIETGQTKSLIDIGMSAAYIEKSLNRIGVNPNEIERIFITHTHNDHIGGLRVFLKKHPATVYLTEKMLEEIDFDIENMSGNYNNNGFSVSAEAGHKFVFNETFFVEPQVGISYGYLKGDGFTASNGVKVEQDNFNSLVGRVGLRGGLTVKDKVSLYAKASVLHDFTGELDTSFTSTKSGSSVKLTDDFEDTWVEYGVGADFQVHQNLKTYAEFERSSSGSVDENWRFNVGMRYLF